MISTLELEKIHQRTKRFTEASFDFMVDVRGLHGPAALRPREFKEHGPRDHVQRYFF